jgi:cephalosporin hydroxylase
MSPFSISAAGKSALQSLTGPLRRRRTEKKIDAQQHSLGLMAPPGAELLGLMEKAEQICGQVKNDAVLGDYFIKNNPWQGRPWHQFNYWNGWYALTRLRKPSNVMEIGTAFGFSTVALARGAGGSLKLLVSLDLGNFGKLFSGDTSPEVDNLLFVKNGLEFYRQENNLDFDYRQFAVNTQPPPYSDNEGNPVACPYWKDDAALQSLLAETSFDLILIDGKHTEDGLYNDLDSFFPFVKSGGLAVCDDLQHPDAARSLHRFIGERRDIAGYAVWRFLHSNSEYGGTLRRDQGLILKR